jgi:hypothetical protein
MAGQHIDQRCLRPRLLLFVTHGGVSNRRSSDHSGHTLLAYARADPARPDDLRDGIEIACR